MTTADILMLKGSCIGIAGLIIIIWILAEIYGIRDEERSTIQEADQ